MTADLTTRNDVESVAVRRRSSADDDSRAPVLLRLPDLNRSIGKIPPPPAERTEEESPVETTHSEPVQDVTIVSRLQTWLVRAISFSSRLTEGSGKVVVITMIVLLIVLALIVIQSTRSTAPPDNTPPIQWDQTVDHRSSDDGSPNIVFTPDDGEEASSTTMPPPLLDTHVSPNERHRQAVNDAHAVPSPDATIPQGSMNFAELQNDVGEPRQPTPDTTVPEGTYESVRVAERPDTTRPQGDLNVPVNATPDANQPLQQNREQQLYPDTGYPEFTPPRIRIERSSQ